MADEFEKPIRFGVRSNETLSRRGLTGDMVIVELEPEGRLSLRGARQGSLCIECEDLVRLRLGFDETQYERLYIARLWTSGGSAPLRLAPLERPSHGYGVAVRRLAGKMAASGELGRIERGLTAGWALFMPACVLVVTGLVGLLALFAWRDQPLWVRLGVFGVTAALPPAFLWRAIQVDMPRRVASLDEVELYLPPA